MYVCVRAHALVNECTRARFVFFHPHFSACCHYLFCIALYAPRAVHFKENMIGRAQRFIATTFMFIERPLVSKALVQCRACFSVVTQTSKCGKNAINL